MKKYANANRNKCRSCGRAMPANYKYNRCEACRNKQAGVMKKGGAVLGLIATAGTFAVKVLTNGKINLKK